MYRTILYTSYYAQLYLTGLYWFTEFQTIISTIKKQLLNRKETFSMKYITERRHLGTGHLGTSQKGNV